jgi:hypothetical protein
MAVATADNAGCFVVAATGDTITGPIFIDTIDWFGGAIAAGDTCVITGLEVGVAAGQTRGVIWAVEAEVADRPYSKLIGKAYLYIECTWTSSNGTLHIHTRPYERTRRQQAY